MNMLELTSYTELQYAAPTELWYRTPDDID
jgi:hypothetical protein